MKVHSAFKFILIISLATPLAAEILKVAEDKAAAAAPLGAQATPSRNLRGVINTRRPRALSPDATAEISFEVNTEAERMQNYRRITYDLKVYEGEYTTCITEIASDAYSQEAIDACTGRDLIKVALDIKYVTMRTMSKMDTKIRGIFVENCFKPYLEDELVVNGCDVMERDALNLMWAGLHFYQIIEANKQKYLFEYSHVPFDVYENLLGRLTEVGGEFFELLNEIDNHKEVTILRIKTLINDRWKLVRDDRDSAGPITPKISHVIEIEQPVDPRPAPEFEIENQHISQFDTEGGFGVPLDLPAGDELYQSEAIGERKLGSRLTPEQQDQRHSSRRIFNAHGKYAGLHVPASEGRPFGQAKFAKNPALRMSLVNRLSGTERAQGQVQFKNIHTPHYSH